MDTNKRVIVTQGEGVARILRNFSLADVPAPDLCCPLRLARFSSEFARLHALAGDINRGF